MSKQDRQGVRTAADIERKYELGQISAQKDTTSKQSNQISQLAQTLSLFVSRMNGELETLLQTVEKANEEIVGLQGMIYPVGSIYVATDETEPSTLFGGEWEFLGEGHLVVGVDQEGEEPQNELVQLQDTCYLWKRTKIALPQDGTL